MLVTGESSDNENGDFYPYACISKRTSKNKIYETVKGENVFSNPFPIQNLEDCYNACRNTSSSLVLFKRDSIGDGKYAHLNVF